MAFEPIFESINSEDSVYLVPYTITNGAVIVVFAFLVPLLTMEINYLRLGVFRNWFDMERDYARNRRRSNEIRDPLENDETDGCTHDVLENICQQLQDTKPSADPIDNTNAPLQDAEDDITSIIRLDEETISSILLDTNLSTHHNPCDGNSILSSINEASTLQNREVLVSYYSAIRKSSLRTIVFWLAIYLGTAIGITMSTQGLEDKVLAIIEGASKFMVSLLLFIVSAKIPQWLGVYHQGSILLVKHSSPYSQNLSNLSLSEPTYRSKLQENARRGVSFHFLKFYVILMPFYCGSNMASLVFSMFLGVLIGFMLMWIIFLTHRKYDRHRNIVAFSSIFILIAISSLVFVRGIAWIQVVWRQYIFEDEDALLTISFFLWLVILISIHLLFLWHTIKVEKNSRGTPNDNASMDDVEDMDSSYRSGMMRRTSSFVAGLPRKPSHPSQLFDPRSHWKDGEKCKFSEMSEFGSINGDDSASILNDDQEDNGKGSTVVEMVGNDLVQKAESRKDNGNNVDTNIDGARTNESQRDYHASHQKRTPDAVQAKRRCPSFCQVCTCYSPEYKESSLLWKTLVWIKVIVITLAHLLFLYFVIVCIGATAQANQARDKLPFVYEAIYNHMNEGPVCAFDNQGSNSNITTFEDVDAAHDAGFLVLHCGACGACSNWEDLKLEWTTRDTISELANICAQRGLFGGEDAITECLTDPSIGWGYECAICWMEDIVCTKEHCAFIFLQSQMINNVANFAVGPDDMTSATCEEANCEAGNPGTFVDCSGATRRRMNITSSIARPGDQQCSIVDIKDWDDLFFGSGLV